MKHSVNTFFYLLALMLFPGMSFASSLDDLYRDVIRSDNQGYLPMFIKNRAAPDVLSEETLLNQVIEKQPSTQNFTKSINLTNERRKKEEERIAKELQWQETLKAIAENRVTPLDLEEINLRASQKEPKAIEVLAWMYTKGVGVQKDFVAAFRLYRQAETLQVPQAKENAIKVYKAMDSHQREELSK